MNFSKSLGRTNKPAATTSQQRPSSPGGLASHSSPSMRPSSAVSDASNNNKNNSRSTASRIVHYPPLQYSRKDSAGITFSKSVLDSHASAYPPDVSGGTVGPGQHNTENAGVRRVHVAASFWLGGTKQELTMPAATIMSRLTRREKRLLVDSEEAYHTLINTPVSPEAKKLGKALGFAPSEYFLLEDHQPDAEALMKDRAFARAASKFIQKGEESERLGSGCQCLSFKRAGCVNCIW